MYVSNWTNWMKTYEDIFQLPLLHLQPVLQIHPFFQNFLVHPPQIYLQHQWNLESPVSMDCIFMEMWVLANLCWWTCFIIRQRWRQNVEFILIVSCSIIDNANTNWNRFTTTGLVLKSEKWLRIPLSLNPVFYVLMNFKSLILEMLWSWNYYLKRSLGEFFAPYHVRYNMVHMIWTILHSPNTIKSFFRRGLVIIATSNREPEKLYENGLQRQNFVPFIPMLKSQVREVNLDSGMDYRRSGKVARLLYFVSPSYKQVVVLWYSSPKRDIWFQFSIMARKIKHGTNRLSYK